MSKKPKELDDAGIADLKPKRKRYTVPDTDQRGLFIRVSPTNVRTFLAVARDGFGKQHWVTLGRTDEVTIIAARDQAREIIKRVKAGKPAIEPTPPEPQTVAAVAENWMTRYVGPKGLRSASQIKRRLDQLVLPKLKDREFASIKRSDIAALLDYVEDKHGARTADQVLGDLRSISNWHASRDDDYVSPFIRGMKRGGNDERERMLDDDEIRTIWKAASDAGKFGAIIKLLLLTGQRRQKIISMRWDDIDAAGVWRIPQEPREKQAGGDLRLPPLAVDIINAQPRLASNPHVFPGRIAGHVTGIGMAKAAFDKKLPPDMPGWTVHDLRRTARSLMSRKETGISRDTAERVLGHSVGTAVSRRYDQHEYDEEKGEALAALAALIERILRLPDDGKVVELAQRRA